MSHALTQGYHSHMTRKALTDHQLWLILNSAETILEEDLGLVGKRVGPDSLPLVPGHEQHRVTAVASQRLWYCNLLIRWPRS